MSDKIIVGCLEICSLPELNIEDIEVRVDTGAKTSSIHVDNVKRFVKSGKPWVRFDIHPDAYNVNEVIECKAPLFDIRKIKSSNGQSEERYAIKTTMTIGDHAWPIELTLTDRSDMSYLMLMGRQGMGDRLLVDPASTFLLNSTKEGAS